MKNPGCQQGLKLQVVAGISWRFSGACKVNAQKWKKTKSFQVVFAWDFFMRDFFFLIQRRAPTQHIHTPGNIAGAPMIPTSIHKVGWHLLRFQITSYIFLGWMRYPHALQKDSVGPGKTYQRTHYQALHYLLHTGKDDPGALDNMIHALAPALSPHVLAYDNRRDGGDRHQDLLSPEPYSRLCAMAYHGKLVFVGAGPTWRTWSILRWFPKPGAPVPVRGRWRD